MQRSKAVKKKERKVGNQIYMKNMEACVGKGESQRLAGWQWSTQHQNQRWKEPKRVRALRLAIIQSTEGQGKNERKRKETKHEVIYVESILPFITL